MEAEEYEAQLLILVEDEASQQILKVEVFEAQLLILEEYEAQLLILAEAEEYAVPRQMMPEVYEVQLLGALQQILMPK